MFCIQPLAAMAYLTLFVPASSNNKNESNVASPIKPQQWKTAMRKDVGTNTNTLAADGAAYFLATQACLKLFPQRNMYWNFDFWPLTGQVCWAAEQ
jgi:hypothetical protein